MAIPPYFDIQNAFIFWTVDKKYGVVKGFQEQKENFES